MAVKECTMIETPSCNENDSIVEVAKEIRQHLLRHIYVLDDSGKPVGVISTTDMNNRVVAEGKDPNSLKAKDIMTSPIVSVESGMDEKEAYKVCAKNQVATCPVTEGGRVVGIVTINELIRHMTQVE